MANKRIFKKYVNNVTATLINDMMATTYMFEGIDKDAVDKAIINLVKGNESALLKANVKFDKTLKGFESSKLYHQAKAKFYHDLYKKINKEFKECVNESLATFNNAFPAELKESLKAEAK